MPKINVEIQYFRDCPNYVEMIERAKEAMETCETEIEYKEVSVETREKAIEIGFRGSPTLIINGDDFEGMPIPDRPNLSCRYYVNGLPSVEKIRSKIAGMDSGKSK